MMLPGLPDRVKGLVGPKRAAVTYEALASLARWATPERVFRGDRLPFSWVPHQAFPRRSRAAGVGRALPRYRRPSASPSHVAALHVEPAHLLGVAHLVATRRAHMAPPDPPRGATLSRCRKLTPDPRALRGPQSRGPNRHCLPRRPLAPSPPASPGELSPSLPATAPSRAARPPFPRGGYALAVAGA